MHSLRLLSAFMAEHGDFDDVRAIRAEMGLGTTEMTERLLRLSGRYGFMPREALGQRFGVANGSAPRVIG